METEGTENISRKRRAWSPPRRPGDSIGAPERTTIDRPSEEEGETSDLEQCERQIDQYQSAQLEAARAIRRITDERLYTERGFDTVAGYAKERHGFSKQRWYQLVAYATVYDALQNRQSTIADSLSEESRANLSTAVDNPGSIPLPSVEAHTRPLQPYKDDPELLATLWSAVLTEHAYDFTRKKIEAVVREVTSSGVDSKTDDSELETSPSNMSRGIASDTSAWTDGSPREDVEAGGDSADERDSGGTSDGNAEDGAAEEDDTDSVLDVLSSRYAPHIDSSLAEGVAESLVAIATQMVSSESPAGEDPTLTQVKAARDQFDAFKSQETSHVSASTEQPSDFVPESSVDILSNDSSPETTSVDPEAIMTSAANGSETEDPETADAEADETQAANAVDKDLTDATLTDPLMAVPMEMLTPTMAESAVPIGVPQAQREAGVPISLFENEGVNVDAADFARKILQHCEETGYLLGLNTTNEHVDWAARTVNPITGCLHTCSYCYARSVGEKRYKQRFHPTFFPSRLAAIRSARVPTDPDHVREKNVFVGSMSDIFGIWIPDWMIQLILDATAHKPELNFMFLTKFPQKLSQFSFSDNAWIGTTVDRQSEVARAEKYLAQTDAKVKWLSCEPMLEHLDFEDLNPFDMVVIGAQQKFTGTCEEFQPEWRWVAELSVAAKKADCKVYIKDNLKRPKELPTVT